MLTIAPAHTGGPLRTLCLGAHSDDIEIGCSGALMTLMASRPVDVAWIVLSATGVRADEARASAGALLDGAAGARIDIHAFRDGFFPYIGAEIKETFEALKSSVSPDIVFTHCRNDLHQDHRLVSELTWNTFRDHLILEYEIPKYDGDLGRPNVFVPLAPEVCDRKIDNLMTRFASQQGKRWFRRDLFVGLLRLRGMEANAPSGFAEAFYARKVVVGGTAPAL
jgi:LmbE family N-acetylglucosaminyl deacetylase